jgi:hypothetical protein
VCEREREKEGEREERASSCVPVLGRKHMQNNAEHIYNGFMLNLLCLLAITYFLLGMNEKYYIILIYWISIPRMTQDLNQSKTLIYRQRK